LDLPIENTLKGENGAKYGKILTPNEIFLTYPPCNLCAEFHQNRIKIVAVGAVTDRKMQVIL